MSQVEVSVIVPVFDNESTLNELIDRQVRVLEKLAVSFELIFVNDGSRDGSLELLRERAAADPRVRVFAMTRNFGGQSAICAGFDQVRGRRTVSMDADLENFPEDIPRLLAPLDRGHDLVCGVRENRRDSLLVRKLPSALLNAYVRRQTGTRVHDVGCAMRAMDSLLIRDLATEGEKRRLVTPLLLRRARSVAEVPIQHRPKGVPGGHTFLSLLGIAMDYYLLTAKRPFLVSGLASGLAVGLGALFLVLGGLVSSAWRVPGVVLLAAGFLAALVSLVGEYVQRLYQLGQGLPFYQLRRDLEDEVANPPDSGR